MSNEYDFIIHVVVYDQITFKVYRNFNKYYIMEPKDKSLSEKYVVKIRELIDFAVRPTRNSKYNDAFKEREYKISGIDCTRDNVKILNDKGQKMVGTFYRVNDQVT